MSDARELAGRVLAHFNNGTTDLAPKQLRIRSTPTPTKRDLTPSAGRFFRITNCHRPVSRTTGCRRLSDANGDGRATSADT